MSCSALLKLPFVSEGDRPTNDVIGLKWQTLKTVFLGIAGHSTTPFLLARIMRAARSHLVHNGCSTEITCGKSTASHEARVFSQDPAPVTDSVVDISNSDCTSQPESR